MPPNIERIPKPCVFSFPLLAITLLTWLLQPFPALADPPLPTPFTITQPDGTTFVVRVWGDEHSNGLETTDGFTILQEPGSGIIIWPATTIGVSSGITRTFQVTVSATITNGNKLTNVVSVTAAQGITIDNQADIEMVGGWLIYLPAILKHK